jgi:hypothetical protein
MLTMLLVCAMCAGQSVKALSLRQKNHLHLDGGLSSLLLIPPVAASLKGKLSEMPMSKMAAEAIDPTAVNLEGYIIQRVSSDSSCNSWEIARLLQLNIGCTKTSYAEYFRFTATSTSEATLSFYTDSKCATTPTSYETITMGDCVLGMSYVYSSMKNAPQSNRPFAIVT